MYTLSNMIRVKTGYDLVAKGFSPDQMIDAMYDLTASNEQERLLLESASLDEIDEWYNVGDIHELILEAITIKRYSQADGKLKALARVLDKHLPENIEVEKDEAGGYAVQVGKPKKTGSLFATVTAQIPFSDGQALSIIFHSPDGDKTKIVASDEIIAFRFLLNKRDITHVVSPEKGKDVSLDEISKRVTRIVAKTSEKFQAKQKAIQEQKAELVQVEADIETATIQLDNEIKAAEKAKVDLEAIGPKVETAKTQVEKLEKVVGEKEKRLAELQAQKTASEGKTHGSSEAPETSHPNEPIAAIEIQGSGTDEIISLFKEIPSQQVFNVGKINGSKYPKTLIGLKSKLEELVKGKFDIEDNELLFKGMSFGGELIASTFGADGQIRVFPGDTKLTVKGKGYKQVYAKELAQAIIEQSLIDVVASSGISPIPEPEPQPEPTPEMTPENQGRKTEYTDWFANYTEISGTGRTTETKRFTTLKEAREFSKGKFGYITKTSDGGSDWNADEKGKTVFVEYFGGFVPSAQEEQKIKNMIGNAAPKPAEEQTREEKQALQKELYALRQQARNLGFDKEADQLYYAKDIEGLKSLVAGAEPGNPSGDNKKTWPISLTFSMPKALGENYAEQIGKEPTNESKFKFLNDRAVLDGSRIKKEITPPGLKSWVAVSSEMDIGGSFDSFNISSDDKKVVFSFKITANKKLYEELDALKAKAVAMGLGEAAQSLYENKDITRLKNLVKGEIEPEASGSIKAIKGVETRFSEKYRNYLLDQIRSFMKGKIYTDPKEGVEYIYLDRKYNEDPQNDTNKFALESLPDYIIAKLMGSTVEAEIKKDPYRLSQGIATPLPQPEPAPEIDPTTPEGYAQVMADEALQIKYQDELDAFFQNRFYAVRDALKSLGFTGSQYLRKEGNNFKAKYDPDFKHVGAGKNLVGIDHVAIYQPINDLGTPTGEDTQAYSFKDDLTKTPEEIAAEIDAKTVEQPEAVIIPEAQPEPLPEGWSESTPGGMATSQDPASGGIVDKEIKSGLWFVIPNNYAIGKLEGYKTRSEAMEALASAVANAPAPAQMFPWSGVSVDGRNESRWYGTQLEIVKWNDPLHDKLNIKGRVSLLRVLNGGQVLEVKRGDDPNDMSAMDIRVSVKDVVIDVIKVVDNDLGKKVTPEPASKEATTDKPSAGYWNAPSKSFIASAEGQQYLSSRGSRISVIKGLNDQFEKINGFKAYTDSELEQANDNNIDAVRDWLVGQNKGKSIPQPQGENDNYNGWFDNEAEWASKTRAELESEAIKAMGSEEWNIQKVSTMNKHYALIEKSVKSGNKITQAVFDSLEPGEQRDFMRKYGQEGIVGGSNIAKPEAVTLANDVLSGKYNDLPPDEMADLVEPIYDLPEDQYGDLMDQVDAYTTELTKKAVAAI